MPQRHALRSFRHARGSFDFVHHDRSDIHLETTRSHEVLNKPPGLGSAVTGAESVSELLHVLGKAARLDQQTTVRRAQVVEVQRFFLTAGKLVADDRQDGLARGYRPRSSRWYSIQRTRLHDSSESYRPWSAFIVSFSLHNAGVRPNADRFDISSTASGEPDADARAPAGPHDRIVTGAQALGPPLHELDLARRDEFRGTDVENECSSGDRGRHARRTLRGCPTVASQRTHRSEARR